MTRSHVKKSFMAALLSLAALSLAACAQGGDAGTAEPSPTPEPELLAPVEISEVMASNKSSLADSSGAFPDWLELHNRGTEAAELRGYWLVCSGDRWQIPSLRLEPGGYALLFCEENDGGEGLRAGFSISSKGETLSLEGPGGTEADRFQVPASEADVSYIRGEDGRILPADHCTPGYENSPAGYEQFQAARTCDSPLQINEVMVYNRWYLPVDEETYYDWVELKNVSGEPLELGGYALADKSGERYPLPAGSLGPGETTLIQCTGGEAAGAPFSLSSGEERLFLTDGSGLRDYVHLKGLRYGGSYGRLEGQNGFFYFDSPSPGRDNSGGARLIAEKPRSSLDSGVYEDADSVTVELTADGEIYYTLDGSDPGPGSTPYTGPITLTETGVIRAVAVREGALPSESLDLSFFLREGHTLPVVSLVTDPSSLFGPDGIYTNPTADWEKQASLSFFEDGNSFSLACGVKLHGATSRIEQEKKSFKIKFKDRYEGELSYDLFGNGVTQFESILLRADQESHFSSLMRDDLMHQVAIEQFPELPSQDYRAAVLYINGQYWGIYNIREAHSPLHYANHYGLDPDTVEHWQGSWPKGSPTDQIYWFAMEHDLANADDYAYVAAHLNIESIIGWTILEAYACNYDINSPNMRFYYSSQDDRTSFALVDLDLGMFSMEGLVLPMYFGYAYNSLVEQLAANDQFRTQLLTELSKALEGPLSDEAMLARIDAMADELRPEIPRDGERWGWSLKYWEREVAALRAWVTEYFPSRALFYVQDAKNLLGMTNEEVETYFGRVLEMHEKS